jgi:adenosylmethionine---8-amino-7-oxononanoate aminotransferase
VLDEVATDTGRSGRMFACAAEAVAPDLLCLAKGLTGGYLPMAATLATERVFQAFLGPPAEGRTFFHGHTYTGNSYPASERRGMRACRAARRHGVFLRPLGDTIVLMPPLSITETEITRLIDAVASGIQETCP